MENVISIIGGDLRIVKLIDILASEGYKVYTYGLERIEKHEKVVFCDTLEEAIEQSTLIIGPLPLTSDRINVSTPFSDNKIDLKYFLGLLKGKRFIAGNITENAKRILEDNDTIYTDLLRREELVVLNAIATAEGAIQIAIQETPRTLHDSNILIMGFGRIGKVLAKMLQGLGANVYCEARKREDIAWIRAFGYKPVYIDELEMCLSSMEVIINTIPFQILDRKRIDFLRDDCLIIDLASYPGGVDLQAAKDRNIKAIWALSLPGKVAPITSAEYIKETIDNIIREIN